mgnify:CR=1 FL=1
MCLIAFALNQHEEYPFILAANRDEFYQRKTAPLHWWEDHANILAGRDLEAMGTWMGMSKEGRFAAVTNYRDLSNIDPSRKSRGDLTKNFLLDQSQGKTYLEALYEESDNYNGFNLLVGDVKNLYHYSNYEKKINAIPDGIHGLSNSLLNTPWPKVQWLKDQLKNSLEGPLYPEDLMKLLHNESLAPDDQLPDTGVGYEMEKKLSAACIRMEGYGTCCSTIILADKKGEVTYYEKTYPVGGRKESEVMERFVIG